jgi:N-acetylneuraminate synthase
MPDPTMLNLTAAFLKGALVIEKHFTHDKTLPGNDHYHAMDVDDLKQFKKNLATLICVGGEKEKKPIDDEAISRSNARRSVVTSRELKQGEKLTEDMLICKRPQHGICPTNWDKLLGATLLNDVAEDQPLQWSDLELVSQGDE